MTALQAVADPRACLVEPTPADRGMQIVLLRAKCGPEVLAVDWIVSLITGIHPLDEYVLKPFAGDWEEFDRAADAWSKAARAVEAIAESYASVPRQVPADEWTGNARAAWDSAQWTVADTIAPIPPALDAMSEYSTALADMALAILELVVELIGMIVDTARRIILEQAVPVVGQAAGVAEATILVGRVTKTSVTVTRQVAAFITAVQRIDSMVVKIARAMSALQALTSALGSVATADHTARATGAQTYR